jgi:hypothetical protein
MISREEVFEKAFRYLGEQYRGKLFLSAGVPENIYWPLNRADYWSVHLPTMRPQELHVRGGCS